MYIVQYTKLQEKPTANVGYHVYRIISNSIENKTVLVWS